MSIRCSVVSDLHLEFEDLELPGGDVLLLAGDCFIAEPLDKQKTDAYSRSLRKRFARFAREELKKYPKVYYVLGNHDHYGGFFEETAQILREFLAEEAPRVKVLDNESEIYEGIVFTGSTLWANYGAGTYKGVEIGRSMNDCQLIRTRLPLPSPDGFDYIPNALYGRKITVEDIAKQHDKAKRFLRKELKKAKSNNLPVIVITHHAPSFLSKGEEYKHSDNGCDEAYYSNQHKMITGNPHIVALYQGHTHSPCLYRIGQTLIASNPRGYFPSEGTARGFDPRLEDFDLEEVLTAKKERGDDHANG